MRTIVHIWYSVQFANVTHASIAIAQCEVILTVYLHLRLQLLG